MLLLIHCIMKTLATDLIIFKLGITKVAILRRCWRWVTAELRFRQFWIFAPLKSRSAPSGENPKYSVCFDRSKKIRKIFANPCHYFSRVVSCFFVTTHTFSFNFQPLGVFKSKGGDQIFSLSTISLWQMSLKTELLNKKETLPSC